MTGCGCFILVAILAALLTLFLRGSTDAGEPFEQAAALAVALAAAFPAVRAIAGVRSRSSARSSVARTRSTVFLRGSTDAGEPCEQGAALAPAFASARQEMRAIAGTKSRSSALSSAAPTRSTVASS